MIRNLTITLSIAMLALLFTAPVDAGSPGKRQPDVVIFVTSQGLYYDSIIAADPVPFRGRFQQLVPTPGGLTTEFGHGDREYVGGRWWVDTNTNGEMDADDHFFVCPLLGPGRTTP